MAKKKATTRLYTIRLPQIDFDVIGREGLNKLIKNAVRKEAAKIKKNGKQISGARY